jgi:hypothetical protein
MRSLKRGMRAAVGIICVNQFRNCANHTQYIGTVIVTGWF